jgi:NSS family neurotransmitter:Na+ symporter
MNNKNESFSTRFGLIAATIGMAIGAGNIWRFPRLAGQYGGSFLVPWFLFLFLWSIPLLITEFSIGKKIRKGTIGSFIKSAGPGFGWMGWFVGICTTAIMFYYSVVCGWSLKYFFLSISGSISTINHEAYWQNYSASIFQPLAFHLVSILIGGFIIYRGIVHGVEKFSRIIVPLLFVLLIIAAIKAITLPGSGKGIGYFFHMNLSDLANYKIWLEGLSQSAWSTGAGWGLLLTYAVYARKSDKIIGNSFITGLGNNFASIIAGLAIIPTVFALSATSQAASDALNSGNQGLAFIVIPQLFIKMPGGVLFSSVFFLALFFAAISSLISMIELAVRLLIDFGFTREISVLLVCAAVFILGAPSAVSLTFFNNQDWVWGLGLLLSGAFFAFTVPRIGVTKFVSDWIMPGRNSDILIRIFKVLFYFLIPVEFAVMLGWWFMQSVQWNPESWWNPFETYSLATALLQWAIVIAFGFLFNRHFVKRINQNDEL